LKPVVQTLLIYILFEAYVCAADGYGTSKHSGKQITVILHYPVFS